MPTPIKVQGKVREIIDHDLGIFTVRLTVPSRATRFKAGQFLHLTLDEFDPTEGYWPESRVFSIASKPRSDYLEIVYSVKGTYTHRMSNELYVGKEVWLKLPYGDFIVDDFISGKEEVVLIAGGTGISPFIPFLLERQENPNPIPLSLFYGIRDENHYLYKDVVEALTGNSDVSVVRGLFDIGSICNIIAKKKNQVCFVSGPPAMIKLFQSALVKCGVPSESVILDAWE